jgi:hypothetical protein
MKKINSKLFTILSLAILIPSLTFAQNVSELVKSGPGDATKLANAYLTPGFKGFGFGMNSGWYGSAKTKGLGKFDFYFIQGTAAFPSKADQTFDLKNLGLSSKTTFNTANSITPTAFGDDRNGAEVILRDNNSQEVGRFNMPENLGINFVPSPQIQATVGIIKNTDISLRYTPKITLGDYGQLQVLGFAVKHEITSLFVPKKARKLIPIDIALAFGYNQLTYDYSIAVADQLDDRNTGQDLKQRVEAKLSGYTFDAIVSKKISVLTGFASVGYNTSKTELNLLGDYIVRTGAPTLTDPTASNSDKFTTFKDPVKINQTDIAGLRGNVGFSLNLAFIRLKAAYSIGEYQAFTAGLGIGIGK